MILSQVDLGLIVAFVLYWYVYLVLLGERKSCMTSVCMHILGIFYTHIQRNIYFSFRQLSPIGTNARSYSKLKITPFNGYILIVFGRLFEQRKAVIENSKNGAVTEKSLAAKLDVFDTEYINR